MVESGGLRVAIEGCGHGTLNAIYASVRKSCEVKGWDAVDLLIIGGDFQAVRNAADLNCMAVPVKYREIGDFHEYYSGDRVAPYLTIFVGGNHEASNHLWELYYGGWVAPNIYYLGAANVVRLGPLRIAGLSGIWKGYNYRKPHYERLPYNQDDVRSIYHVRELDTRKLLQLRSQVDIGISHDWPKGVEWLGDFKTLFRKKDQFEAEARAGTLGSVAAKVVLDHLKPLHWFSAHLHIKYAAIVEHSKSYTSLGRSSALGLDIAEADSDGSRISKVELATVRNDEEIDLEADDDEPSEPLLATSAPARNADEIDLNDDDGYNAPSAAGAHSTSSPSEDAHEIPSAVDAELRAQLPASFAKPISGHSPLMPEPPTSIKNTLTRFLALDKCLPNRHFLQMLQISPHVADGAETQTGPPQLSYDPEWLAITRVFANELQLGNPSVQLHPDRGRAHYLPRIEEEEKWVEENIIAKGGLMVPENFSPTAPVYSPPLPNAIGDMPREYSNPQTEAFCALLHIPNAFAASEEEIQKRMISAPRPEQSRGGGFGRGRRGRGGRGDGVGRGHGFARGGRGRGTGRGR